MYKKWFVWGIVLLVIAGLYIVEISKIETGGDANFATLDDISPDETDAEWEPFYHVRATIIDGQTARFFIPKELRELEGESMTLTGAAVFYGNGCERKGDEITVRYFFLLPSLGLAQACVLQPDVKMRWTVRVNLIEPWLLHRDDMINAMIKVEGRFNIDTSKPYEAAFYLNNATATLLSEETH